MVSLSSICGGIGRLLLRELRHVYHNINLKIGLMYLVCTIKSGRYVHRHSLCLVMRQEITLTQRTTFKIIFIGSNVKAEIISFHVSFTLKWFQTVAQ